MLYKRIRKETRHGAGLGYLDDAIRWHDEAAANDADVPEALIDAASREPTVVPARAAAG
jgi:hypothetical protein